MYVQVDARLGDVNATDGYFVAARIWEGGCKLISSTGVFFYVYPATQRFVVSADIGQ